MDRKVRIAGIGGWHTHAIDFTDRIMRDENAEVAAVWDNDQVRGRQWAQRCKCPFVEDIDALMADPQIDAVTISCETTLHYEMILRAAQAGKHIYVEKPPFVSAKEAYEAQRIIRENHVKFMLGSPIVKPMHLKTKELIEAGLLGQIISMRYRTVHELAFLGTQKDSFFQKDANGGGAMLDMGNHALHLLSWFAGGPVQTEAIYTSYTEKAKKYQVDDNDILAMAFENGVLGTIETGWITPWYQYGFDLYGTLGCVSCRAYEMFVCLADGVWRRIPEEELPEPQTYPLHYWIDCIHKNAEITWDDIDVAVLMTEMSEAVEAAAELPLLKTRNALCMGTGMQGLETARQICEAGTLGVVTNIRIHYSGDAELEALEAMAMADLESFFGPAVGKKCVAAEMGPLPVKGMVTLLRYGQNHLGVAEVFKGMPEYENSVDICGTHGWLRIRGGKVSYTGTEPGNRNAVWEDIK